MPSDWSVSPVTRGMFVISMDKVRVPMVGGTLVSLSFDCSHDDSSNVTDNSVG